MPKDHIQELDGLRGIAVLTVLIGHVHINFAFKNIFEMATHLDGDLGVDIFFVLSGFLITRLLLTDIQSNRTKLAFYQRRAARLVPAYILLLSFVVLIWGLGPELPWSLSYTYNYGRFFRIFTGGDKPLGHTWSLCVEEHFYLVWPWIVWNFGNKSKYICLLAISISLFSAFLLNSGGANGIYEYIRVYQPTHTRLIAISIGCLIALHENMLKTSNNYLLILTSLFQFLFLLLSSPMLFRYVGINIEDYPLAIALIKQNLQAASIFTITLFGVFKGWGPVTILLGDRRLCFVGKISYGLYLFHFPVYWLFSVAGPGEQESLIKPWIAILSVFVISAVSYHFYEEPLRRWGRNFTLKKSSAVAETS